MKKLKFDDYLAFGLLTSLVLLSTIYYFYKKSKKYVQDDPYVAKVDLHERLVIVTDERYGKLEQRQVVIEDLPSETLVLLKRDGKLNDATIRKLVKMGKLPDENGKYSNSGEVKGSNTNSNTPSNTRTTTRSGASSNPSSTPTTTKTESTDETVKSTKMKRKAKKKK